MSDRPTWAYRRAVRTVAAGLLVGACSTGTEVSPVTSPTATAAAVGTPVPVPLPPMTAPTPTTSADADEVAATDEVAITTATATPTTMETPAPTSTWVVFEEVEDLPAPPVFEGVRVPQSEADVKGALFWYPSGSHGPGSPPKRFEHAGEVFDLCRIEDAYFGTYGWYLDAGDIPGEYRRDWFRSFAPGDCRGPELAKSRPLLDIWPERYFTFDDAGSKSPPFASPQEATEWYAEAVGEYGENTIPAGMLPAGSYGGLGDSVPLIEYSDAADPLDEVRVLLATIAVGDDGVLRGLVRNWSRTLWAYGTVVSADEREWVWPLSIQPGETAPFEIENWNGSTDPALVEFSVTAEMSNDADLSRAWWGWWDWQYYEEESNDGDTDPDFDRYSYERLSPVSHPLGEALWAPTLALDLAVYWVELNSEGAVVEVAELEFHEYGPSRDIADLGDTGAQVRGSYPRAESWTNHVGFFVPFVPFDPPRSPAMSWIGMPHPRADQ